MRPIIDFFVGTYLGGFICLFGGVAVLFRTIKYTKKDPASSLQPYTSGIVSGIGLFVIGIIVLINKLLGNW